MSMKRSQSRVTENEEICGTCRYHRNDGTDWVCINQDSEYYSDWTEYGDQCEEWEERS